MKVSLVLFSALFAAVVSNSFVDGRLFCFRRVRRGNRCGGYMRRARYSSPQACCSGKGQGFSERKIKLGRNRFRCVPCLGLVGTGSEKSGKRSRQKAVTFIPRPRPPSPRETSTTSKPVFTQGSTTAFFWPTPAGREVAVGNPYPLPRDDDGNVIVWEQWSPCSVTCGAGWRSRAKVCDSCDRNDYENVQSQPCMDNFYCPVDGNWGAWYPWEACSATCGQGSRSRRRKCNYPPPAFGGEPCAGDALALKDCVKEDCPVDGSWGPWSEFSPCSQSCGPGTMTRSRHCDSPRPSQDGRPCQGEALHSTSCHLGECPVHGGWSPWSKWSPCSASCDSGTIERSRTCDDPVPQDGGRPCEGESTQQQFCYTTMPCPVDGGWTEWSNYGPCRAPSCGRGIQIRSRSCAKPRPAHGGKSCSGHQFKRVACYNQRTCPQRDGAFCTWSAWNTCSASCKEDTPLQGRQRVCACPTPRHGGKECVGEMFQVKECEDVSYCFPPLEEDVGLVLDADAESEEAFTDQESSYFGSSSGTIDPILNKNDQSGSEVNQEEEADDSTTGQGHSGKVRAFSTPDSQTANTNTESSAMGKPVQQTENDGVQAPSGEKIKDDEKDSRGQTAPLSKNTKTFHRQNQKQKDSENNQKRMTSSTAVTSVPKQGVEKEDKTETNGGLGPNNDGDKSGKSVAELLSTDIPFRLKTGAESEDGHNKGQRRPDASRPQRIRIILNASKSARVGGLATANSRNSTTSTRVQTREKFKKKTRDKSRDKH